MRVNDNFNPRAPHGARPADQCDKYEGRNFNPRAPHGARRHRADACNHRDHFNPRAPHGARQAASLARNSLRLFQSTRSAWSATNLLAVFEPLGAISIHALRMERDVRTPREVYSRVISIHALRMERDHCRPSLVSRLGKFQSTRSAWSATRSFLRNFTKDDISIHALRMERDLSVLFILIGRSYFNPRAPLGARLLTRYSPAGCLPFQSTRSAWSATPFQFLRRFAQTISIHALRMERDVRGVS